MGAPSVFALSSVAAFKGLSEELAIRAAAGGGQSAMLGEDAGGLCGGKQEELHYRHPEDSRREGTEGETLYKALGGSLWPSANVRGFFGDVINLLVPHGAVNPSAAPMGLPVEGLK